MKIAALDLSLTATGWATRDGSGVLNPPRGRDRGMERLAWIRSQVLRIVDDADLVVLEGYAYGSKRQSHTRSIAELGGVVRMTLHDLGYRWVDMAPATLKKLATGKGNAGKELVLVEAVKRLEYSGADNNEADALWLLTGALIRYRLIDPEIVPKAHRAALDAVEWPNLNGGGE